MKSFQQIGWFCGLSILLIGLVMGGCDQSGENDPSSPVLTDGGSATFGSESKSFTYERGATAGIEITAEFAKYHIKDQPYGDWVANATWRHEDRNFIVEMTVPFTIDPATGIGRANLPAGFLNQVFQAAYDRYHANQDERVWQHRPGLYLNVFADDVTYQYYSFPYGTYGGAMSNWSFGGSLSDLVQQLGFGWWPFLPPRLDEAVLVNLGDPITIQQYVPTPGPTCGGVLMFGYCWYSSGDGNSCNTACLPHGGDVLHGKVFWTNRTDADCAAVLNALGVASGVDDFTGTWGNKDGCEYDGASRLRGDTLAPITATFDAAYSGGGEFLACACAN